MYQGLRSLGWDGCLVAASDDEAPGMAGRLRRYGRVLLNAQRAARGVDILYIRSHPLAAAVVALPGRRRARVVVEVNGTFEDLGRAHPRTRILASPAAAAERFLLRRADRAVAVSPDLADWVGRVAPGVPTTVVPNAADAAVFHPGATTGLKLPSRYVAFCGALADWQGIEVVLEATRQPAWPAEVSVVFAGDGALSSTVAAEAARNPRVLYLGVVDQRDVAGLLAGSLAGLSPNTRRERAGNAMKLYEALACGAPVVASDVPGQRELIEGSAAGVVYGAENPVDLAGSVARLCAEPDWQSVLARNAREVGARQTWHERASDTAAFVAPGDGAHTDEPPS